MKTHKLIDLSKYNSYELKSYCSEAFFPESELEILEIFKKNRNKTIIILGNGNNIIFSKELYEESFLILNGNFHNIEIIGTEIIAEAGANLLQLSELALTHSLSGLEIFYDIPSSVGGAVVMNAGTKDGEIKDILTKVRYLDLEDFKIKEISKERMDFKYRNSFFQKNTDKLVLKAWFNLTHGNAEEIKNKMEINKQIRLSKQPREFPNGGSVFKRPPGRFVGPMIDELGLKGYMIGGAQISEKHSGFIINRGNATGKDILQLIALIQKKVKDIFKVDLEVEQRII